MTNSYVALATPPTATKALWGPLEARRLTLATVINLNYAAPQAGAQALEVSA